MKMYFEIPVDFKCIKNVGNKRQLLLENFKWDSYHDLTIVFIRKRNGLKFDINVFLVAEKKD